jgi:hypothetical protein
MAAALAAREFEALRRSVEVSLAFRCSVLHRAACEKYHQGYSSLVDRRAARARDGLAALGGAHSSTAPQRVEARTPASATDGASSCIQSHSALIVYRAAAPAFEENAKAGAADRLSGVACLRVEQPGSRVVLGHSSPHLIQESQNARSLCVASVARTLKQTCCVIVVLLNCYPVLKHDAKSDAACSFPFVTCFPIDRGCSPILVSTGLGLGHASEIATAGGLALFAEVLAVLNVSERARPG